jgi:Uma2 family endonuclease
MPLPKEQHYTYADLLAWNDETRYELYDGQPVALASPSHIHQQTSIAISAQLYNFLEGKKCTVYAAPLDVRLFEDDGDRPEDIDIVLQPDLMVVCDKSKVDRHGVHGTPDFVIEILSDSTRKTDRFTKFALYQKAGVREYWIVDPDAHTVAVHVLEDGQYGSPDFYSDGATVPVSVLTGCTIDLSRVFTIE